jgi:hypothetical protein
VRAILVIVRSWIAAGRPKSAKTLGSFESWAAILGGILEHIGVDGFLEDTRQLYEDADAEGQEWREFVGAWWDTHGGAWVAAGTLLKLTRERDLLCATVGDKSERSQMSRLGRALLAARDRQFGTFRIAVGRNGDRNAAQYRLLPLGHGFEAAASGVGARTGATAPSTLFDVPSTGAPGNGG